MLPDRTWICHSCVKSGVKPCSTAHLLIKPNTSTYAWYMSGFWTDLKRYLLTGRFPESEIMNINAIFFINWASILLNLNPFKLLGCKIILYYWILWFLGEERRAGLWRKCSLAAETLSVTAHWSAWNIQLARLLLHQHTLLSKRRMQNKQQEVAKTMA